MGVVREQRQNFGKEAKDLADAATTLSELQQAVSLAAFGQQVQEYRIDTLHRQLKSRKAGGL